MTAMDDGTSDLQQLLSGISSVSAVIEDSVLWITMGKEESRHAMFQEVFRDLGDIFDRTSLDDDVRVVVLTGEGRRFSTGGNVRGMAERAGEAGRTQSDILSRSSSTELLARMYRNMLRVDQPIIASVNGDAVGAGTTIALHCDIILAAESARFGDPHVRRGLVASAGAYIWPLVTGLNIAKEYLLTGDLMSATEAHRLGLVNHVYDDAILRAETSALAGRIAAGAPHAVRWTKRLLNRLAIRQLDEILDDGIAHELLTFGTEDHREGVASFLEKRPARFQGR
jgi:enoyl-CoA hydratase